MQIRMQPNNFWATPILTGKFSCVYWSGLPQQYSIDAGGSATFVVKLQLSAFAPSTDFGPISGSHLRRLFQANLPDAVTCGVPEHQMWYESSFWNCILVSSLCFGCRYFYFYFYCVDFPAYSACLQTNNIISPWCRLHGILPTRHFFSGSCSCIFLFCS